MIIKGSEYISSARAAEITRYSNDYVGQLCRKSKVSARMIGRTWYVSKESLLKHQKVAEISKHLNGKISTNGGGISGPAKLVFLTRIYPVMSKRLIKTVAIALILLAGVPALASVFSANKVFVQKVPEAAGVYGAFGAASAFIHAMYADAVAYVTHDRSLSINVNSANAESPVEQGVAVIPSTNTVGGDETEKQNVRNSFSDQVSLQADTSGTAGVITPVFKQTTGKNFMYVIVPVKKTASSP